MISIGICSICHENVKMAEFGILRNCPHGFHRRCIEQWLHENYSCPMCRSAACVRDIIKPIIDPPVMLANVDQLAYDRLNAQQMLKFDSILMKNNKIDPADCAWKLNIEKNELLVTSSGFGWRCARAILPVPKFNQKATEAYIAFYFEGHIKKISNLFFDWRRNVGIGLCSQQFPLEGKYIGQEQNSIGFTHKKGMDFCGGFIQFQNACDPFKTGDKIGLGLIYEPKNASVKCFGICNRKLLGSVELSPKFFDMQIFPVVGSSEVENSIQLNFGNEDWDFDPRKIIHLFQ